MNVLRRRLLAQHLVVTAVILLAAGAVLFALVRRSAYARLETTLRKQIEKMLRSVNEENQ